MNFLILFSFCLLGGILHLGVDMKKFDSQTPNLKDKWLVFTSYCNTHFFAMILSGIVVLTFSIFLSVGLGTFLLGVFKIPLTVDDKVPAQLWFFSFVIGFGTDWIASAIGSIKSPAITDTRVTDAAPIPVAGK